MKRFYHFFLALLLTTYPKFCYAARPSPEDIYGYGAKGGTGLGETFDTILMIAILLGLALNIVTTGKTKGFLKGVLLFAIGMYLPCFLLVGIFMTLKPMFGKTLSVIIIAVLGYTVVLRWIKFLGTKLFGKNSPNNWYTLLKRFNLESTKKSTAERSSYFDQRSFFCYKLFNYFKVFESI